MCMKNILHLIIITSILQSYKPAKKNFQIECQDVLSGEQVKLNVWDSKRKLKYRISAAQRDAVYSILFSDMNSGNCNGMPPLLRNEAERNAFDAIADDFFSYKGDWKKFVRVSTIKSTSSQLTGSDNSIYEITVSKGQLRNFLIEKNILKSLNHGF